MGRTAKKNPISHPAQAQAQADFFFIYTIVCCFDEIYIEIKFVGILMITKSQKWMMIDLRMCTKSTAVCFFSCLRN